MRDLETTSAIRDGPVVALLCKCPGEVFDGDKNTGEVTMLVKDVMVTKDLLTIAEDQRLGAAAQRMLWGRVRHLPVVRGQEVVGVLSERDILSRRGDGTTRGWEDITVDVAMSRPACVAVPEEDLAQAAARLTARGIGCLPVVVLGRLVGMLTTTDMMGAVVTDLFRTTPNLQKPVRAAMRKDVFAVRADEDLMEVVSLMQARGIRHLPVVDPEGKVVGILSDRDLRTALGDPMDALESWPSRAGHVRAGAVMTTNPIVIGVEAPLSSAVATLLNRRVGALPVVDQAGHLRGILSYVDVIHHLAQK